MAKTLPSQRIWDTIEILRITKGENIAENDTKLLAPSFSTHKALSKYITLKHVLFVHSIVVCMLNTLEFTSVARCLRCFCAYSILLSVLPLVTAPDLHWAVSAPAAVVGAGGDAQEALRSSAHCQHQTSERSKVAGLVYPDEQRNWYFSSHGTFLKDNFLRRQAMRRKVWNGL